MKKLIFLIFISYSVLIPCVLTADTCTACNTTWSDSGKACSDDDTYISCLINAYPGDEGCDTRHDKMKEAKDHRDKITEPSTCTALSETCDCQVIYHSLNVAGDKDKCTVAKIALGCLIDATDDTACSGATVTARKDVVAAFKTIATTTTGCSLTEMCKCQVDYHASDIGDTTKKCNAAKTAVKCLVAQSDAVCTESAITTQTEAVSPFNSYITGESTCTLTDTCKCQTDYYSTDVTDSADKCTALKKEMYCLASANDLACDGKKRNEIATAVDKLIVDDDEPARSSTVKCRTDLTLTCKCTIDYAKNATADMCTAATGLKDCVTEITPDTVLACDGTTQTGNYLNSTITQIVQQACSGTVILLSMSVVAGYLVILFEMFLE